VTLTIVFLLGGALCLFLAARGLRGGPLWIDVGAAPPFDDSPDGSPRPLTGVGARVLGVLYLLTGLGCGFALLTIW
jgi:hypothetical protein